MNKTEIMSTLNCSVDNDLNIKTYYGKNGDIVSSSTGTYSNTSCWGYWQNDYYPYVIRESYPVYIQERAVDKGQKAFEIIKILKDKKLAQISKVSDFIDLMDALIKIL